MHLPAVSVPAGSCLRYRERALPPVGPESFLAETTGMVRGFWGRGDRWVAWAGEIGRIEVDGGEPSVGRFDFVRREAGRILGGTQHSWADLAPARRPRFFGGFSFLEVPGRDPVWERFPSACFVLPRVVLEGRPRMHRLRLQELDGEAERGDAPIEELAGRLIARADRDGDWSTPGGGGSGLDEPPRTASAIERDRWEAAVGTVLQRVEDGSLRKVVLARILDARFPGPSDPLVALRFLRGENPRAHVFLFEPRPGRVFLGAAPEILAELRGGCFEATAVAGSVPRGSGSDEDRILARRLLESAKDRSEHRFTAEEMAEVLEPRLVGMEVEEEPRVLRLARIQHLETAIRGRALDREDVLSLVEALHPTPAVCGRPRAVALESIRAAEPFERGWYAGPIGWFDAAGDGDFVPGLRSAVGGGAEWRLFAGAGIVAGSDPGAEWDETALKFEPALRALAAGAG